MIKPTVGRKVWYRPSAFDKTGPIPMVTSGDAPLDATVVCVHGDRMVNLVIFDCYGKQFNKTSVTLIQEGDKPPVNAEGAVIGGFCEWMPYQAAQAKKHEAEAKPE